MGRTLNAVALALAAGIGWADTAAAQSLGTFRWQLQPYCNVVNLTVTYNGGLYTLDGYDDQCGASTRASAVGTAVPNPNGSITLGFSIVTTPGGAPVHVQTAIDLGSLGGSWSDSAGNTGSFVFTPGAGTGGSPRPAPTAAGIPDNSITSAKIADGTIGALDIDPTQVQQRIQSACPAGQLMSGVMADGAVTCESVTSGAGGDITAVTAGTGLNGGGTTGDVLLQVSFSGTGTSTAAAKADHTHAAGTGGSNTKIGAGALAVNTFGQFNTALGAATLAATTTGASNTAVGYNALTANSGDENTALGATALQANTSGLRNTAIGYRAMALSTGARADNTAVGHAAALSGGTRNTAIGVGVLELADGTTSDTNTGVGYQALRQANGSSNVAIGAQALDTIAAGDDNTALGASALTVLTTGSDNVAIGRSAGLALTAGSDNVYIANSGANESGTMRLGSANVHGRTFIAGIRGVTTGLNNAVTVVVDGNGQLGTVSSSRATKFDIADLDPSVTAALRQLRPVQFRYTQAFADGATPLQYGLIAEEVDEVLPALVAYDADGAPATVKYHVLPALLLAEVQRLSREVAALQAQIASAPR